MSKSVIDEPVDVTDKDKPEELWNEHLRDDYGNLPRKNQYEKVVDKVVKDERLNQKEIIKIRYHSSEEKVEYLPVEVDVKSKFDVNRLEDSGGDVPRVLDSVEIVECDDCSGSGTYCDDCSGNGEIICPENNCENGIIKLDCDNCDYNNKVEKDCAECDGSGYSVEHQCNKCNGTSRYYDAKKDKEVKCTVCDSGVYRDPCSNCNISGKAKQECSKCNGTGEVRKGQCNTCSQFVDTSKGKVTCEVCNGGNFKVDCSKCNGKGDIKKVTFLNFIVKTKIIEIEDEDIFETGIYDRRDNDPSKLLEYEIVEREEYESIEEFKISKNDSVDQDLEDELSDNVETSNVISVEYECEQTQKLISYIYKNSDNVRTYKTRERGLFNSLTHYLRKDGKYNAKTVRVDIFEGNGVVASTDTSNIGYASDLKLELVNMSSDVKLTLLDRKSEIKVFIPATILRIFRSPWKSIKSMFLTYIISGWFIAFYVYYPYVNRAYMFPFEYPVGFLVVSFIIFSYVNMRHKIH